MASDCISSMQILLRILFICSLAATVRGLPNGAPSGACTDMMPRHKNTNGGGFLTGQTGNSPYSIMMSAMEYNKSTSIRVWISGGTTNTGGYRGVLLQARTVGGNAPVGTWKNTPMYTKRVQCSATNDTVTHSEVANVKNGSTVFEWMPSGNHNNVQFVATVAETHDVFWVMLKSNTVKYNSCGRMMPPLLILCLSVLVHLVEM